MIRWESTFFRSLYYHKNVPKKYKAMDSLDIKFGSACHRIYGAIIILCKLQALSTCSFKVIFNKTCPFCIVCWSLMEFLFNLSLICYQQTSMIYDALEIMAPMCYIFWRKPCVFYFFLKDWWIFAPFITFHFQTSMVALSFLHNNLFLRDADFCYFPLLYDFESISV